MCGHNLILFKILLIMNERTSPRIPVPNEHYGSALFSTPGLEFWLAIIKNQIWFRIFQPIIILISSPIPCKKCTPSTYLFIHFYFSLEIILEVKCKYVFMCVCFLFINIVMHRLHCIFIEITQIATALWKIKSNSLSVMIWVIAIVSTSLLNLNLIYIVGRKLINCNLKSEQLPTPYPYCNEQWKSLSGNYFNRNTIR